MDSQRGRTDTRPDDHEAERRRRAAQGAEAFERRAKAMEARWLAGLMVGGSLSPRAPFPASPRGAGAARGAARAAAGVGPTSPKTA